MRSFRRPSTAKDWARFAMKWSLFLTDAKLWSSLTDQMRDHAEEVGDGMRRRYEDTSDRLHNANDALRGRSDWVAPTACFLGGVGLGVGLGMLFAPVSGEETRAAIRDRAMDMKNRVGEMATGSGRFRSTGTDGD